MSLSKCGAEVHDNVRFYHEIMLRYCGYKYNKKTYFICSTCKKIEEFDYQQFFEKHGQHLSLFSTSKDFSLHDKEIMKTNVTDLARHKKENSKDKTDVSNLTSHKNEDKTDVID